MAWDDCDISVEFHQFGEDAGHKCVVIGPLVVCAAYAACKEGVSAEENLFRALEIADSTRCVSRSLDNFETQVSYFDNVSFLDGTDLGSAC